MLLKNSISVRVMKHNTRAQFFLSRVSILLLTRDIDIVILSVCLSVRDTLVLYENGLTHRHSFFTVR